MRFVLKILAFIVLLLISKLNGHYKQVTNPAESPQVIVSTQHSTALKPPSVLTGGHTYKESILPVKTLQTVVATPATIK